MAELLLSRAALAEICDAARMAHPLEACGLLTGAGHRVGHATRAANVADRPATRFEIDPAHLLAAHRAARSGGPSIIGYWHSHPTGIAAPSAMDAAMAAPDGRIWLIVGGNTVAAFRAVAQGAIHGRFVEIPWSLVDPRP